jgi:tetratricopeptide (TPR) repeat protein
MAPEQARAGGPAADPPADVFSLGAVLYHCLTGAEVFGADDPTALLAKIVLDDISRTGVRLPDVPDALEDLIGHMLDRDPARRPRDGGAVVAALRALPEEDEPPPSPVPSTRPELGTGERRVVIVVLVSGGLAGMPAAMGDPQRVPHPPPEPPSPPEPPEPPSPPEPPEPLEPLSVLRAAVEARHGRFEALADGALAAVLPGAGLAEDRVAIAAECAVALRTLLPRRPMALALGRTGEAIDRAARLLRGLGRLPDRAGDAGYDGGHPQAPGIAVDEIAAALLERRFDLGEGPAGRELRGGRPPIESPRTLLGRPTPCVGREREIDTLAAVFERCTSEPRARAALVTAPAGFGKSRLAHELLERLYGHAEIWIGRGDPSSAGSAFALLAAALKHTAGVFDGDPLPLRREKLRARIARNMPSASGARVAAFLGELVGTPFPDDAAADLSAARRDAVLMGDQMRRAWVDFVRAECAWSNVVLVLDDLHWGDLPSLQLVDAALAALPGRPLMVLGLGRPEVHDRFPRLWAEHDVAELRLGGLAPEASARLVKGVLGDTVAEGTARWLVDQSDGHPLYLEELIRAAALGPAEDPERRGVDTVRAMVEMRLGRLDPEARRVLRIASIFGETFWAGGVTALFGDPAELARRLGELAGEELVVRHAAGRFAGEQELSFRHALVREAAYATLTEEDQRLGHRLAGEWLERAGETDAMVLAAHFEAGRDFGRAAGWYLRATEQAFGGNDLDAVIERAGRGAACGARAYPEGPGHGAASGDPRALGALSLYQAEAHRWRGDLPAAERHAGEAMTRLVPGSALWFAAARERILSASGERLLSAVLRVQAAPRDETVAAAQLGALGAAHARLLAEGRRDLAAEILPAIEAFSVSVAAEDAAAAQLHDARAQHAFHTGDAAGFLRTAEAARAAFERAGDQRNAGTRRIEIGRAWGLLGVHDEAEHALRTAVPEAARMGLAAVAALGRHQLGVTLARLGRLEDAKAAVDEAARALAVRGPSSHRALGVALSDLATILLQLAEDEGPERLARAAIERLGAARDPAGGKPRGAPASGDGARAHALASLAEILLSERRAAEALEAAHAALASISAPEGGTPLDSVEARVRLVHVEALAATGDHTAARAALSEARLRILARGAALGDTNLRRSFLEGVAENARTLDLSRLAGIPARLSTPPPEHARRPPPSPENEREACLREAKKALERGNPDAAITHVERGMNHAAPGEVRAELRALMARAHGMRNAWVSSGRWAEQGLREAAPGSRGWYAAFAARMLAAAQIGERAEIVGAADALPRLAAGAGAGPAVAVALAALGSALAPLGETARVQDCFDRLERAGAPLAARDPVVRAWMSRAAAERARVLEEDPWTALRLDESSRASFVEAGDGAEAALSLVLIGVDRWQLGAYERAEEALRAAIDAGGPQGHLAAFAGVHLAWTLADAGRLAEASASLLATARAEPSRTNPSLRAAASAVLADIFRRRRDPEGAEREAEAALSTPGLTPLARTATLATQSAVRLDRGRPAEALDLARRARNERETLRVFGFRDAFVRLCHVEALLAVGDIAGARTPLSRAYARLLVHSSKIGDPALRASFLERVPEHARTLALARQWLGDVSDHAFR